MCENLALSKACHVALTLVTSHWHLSRRTDACHIALTLVMSHWHLSRRTDACHVALTLEMFLRLLRRLQVCRMRSQKHWKQCQLSSRILLQNPSDWPWAEVSRALLMLTCSCSASVLSVVCRWRCHFNAVAPWRLNKVLIETFIKFSGNVGVFIES